MITTFTAMPPPVLPRRRSRSSIIAALGLCAAFALLAGCSAVKLGYNQGNAIAFTWLDDWVDFDGAQSLRVRAGLDEWFAWHRRTQLTDYADRLARLKVEVREPTTPERVCRLSDELRARIDAGIEHAMPTLVEVVVTLRPEQIANVEKKFKRRNDDYRDDYLQPDPAERRRAAVRRDVERAEKLYGDLDDAQRALVERAVAESPFDAEVALAERREHQRDALRVLSRLAASRDAGGGDAEAQIRAYLARLERSPRQEFRRYAQRLRAYNCSYAAALHNSTTAAQRAAAARTLKGYEDDFRALAAEGAS